MAVPYDVIVAGKGNAALCAALSAQEQGAKVLMLEAAPGGVREFNAAVRTQVPFDHTIKDGRGTQGITPPKTNWANPLDTPPFEAYATTCGITFTFGGVRIDRDSGQVLDLNLNRIPGLYAAGEMVGGLFYFNYASGTGLVSGAVFGRIAGRGAARAAK